MSIVENAKRITYYLRNFHQCGLHRQKERQRDPNKRRGALHESMVQQDLNLYRKQMDSMLEINRNQNKVIQPVIRPKLNIFSPA